MISCGVTMDSKFYGVICDKLGRRGYWKEAQMVFTEIHNAGFKLDSHVYDIMLANTAKNASFQDCLR